MYFEWGESINIACEPAELDPSMLQHEREARQRTVQPHNASAGESAAADQDAGSVKALREYTVLEEPGSGNPPPTPVRYAGNGSQLACGRRGKALLPACSDRHPAKFLRGAVTGPDGS